MCVEWLKANGHASAPPAPAPPPLERDLFGAPMVPPSTTPMRAPAPSSATPTTPRPIASVTPTALASFQALGIEVGLDSEELGPVWLVPAYTGTDRHELTFEHAALLASLCSALPSARITALVRKAKATSA
jgi:hypothetical protein